MPRNTDPIERFDALWRAHLARVLAYARRRAHEERARDAVAETFTVAWRRLDQVPDDALPWLLGVCAKVLSNQRRGDARRRRLLDRLRGLAPEALPDTAERSAEAEAIRHAFLGLPRRDREALALACWDGLSAREAAGVCGCSEGAFEKRLSRARTRFRAALAAADATGGVAPSPSLEESS
jgi:RNA polymerase sigma-70 factor (ECF subfamily)